MKTLGFAFLLLVVPGSLFADRAHDLAIVASKQKGAAGCDPSTLTTKTCHQQFLTGCTDAQSVSYDPYLNFLKNQIPGASLASTAVLGQTDFQSKEGQIPAGLGKRNHAQLASQFASLGEGNIVTVFAYLYFAEDTRGSGNNPSPGETCNCKLTLVGSYDFHIGLGFDKSLAAQVRQKKVKASLSQPSALEKTSVVAEMTPHTRGTKWTLARVTSLLGQQVKVLGQLMADNEHFNKKDDCGFSGATAKCWRSTIWEIHPVTQFFVCNVSSGCDVSSPDSAWTSLDKVP